MINFTRQFYIKAALVWLAVMVLGGGGILAYQYRDQIFALNKSTEKEKTDEPESAGII